MSRRLNFFGLPGTGELAKFLFSGFPEPPPDSVPLRILGLETMPAHPDTIQRAFRQRVRLVHPDLEAYTAATPGLQLAAEAVALQNYEVQELKWARDTLLDQVWKREPPVTDSQPSVSGLFSSVTPPAEDRPPRPPDQALTPDQLAGTFPPIATPVPVRMTCSECRRPIAPDQHVYNNKRAGWRRCTGCADPDPGERDDAPHGVLVGDFWFHDGAWQDTTDRYPDWRVIWPCQVCGRVLHMDHRRSQHGRWIPWWHECGEACTRRRRRPRLDGPSRCTVCGTPVTLGRGDARYCSPACRQKAYRQRRRDAT